MHKLFFLSLFVVTMLSGNAQKVSQPNKVKYYGPVEIQSPILLDSMSLSQEKFSDRTLLESQISFPDISRFSTELTPDSSGFFHLTKPQRNHYFHLISFFVSADGYGKGKIKVTSPNMLEIYVNNERKNTKTGVSDSLKNAGSLEHAFNGFVNSNRIVIKLLSSANDKIDPAVKIEFQPEKSDSLLAYSFATEESRWINITDISPARDQRRVDPPATPFQGPRAAGAPRRPTVDRAALVWFPCSSLKHPSGSSVRDA